MTTRYTKEFIDAQREYITKGMRMTADVGGPVTVAKKSREPDTDFAAIRERLEKLRRQYTQQ